MKTIATLLFSMVFIACSTGQPETWNLDFEEWVDSTLVDASSTFSNANGHIVTNPFYGTPANWTVTGMGCLRTTDANSGQYAVVVSQWYSLAPGILQFGICENIIDVTGKNCKVPASQKIDKIRGYYKFFSEVTGYAKAFFYGFRVSDVNMTLDTIASVEYDFAPTGEYTEFEIPIVYSDTIGAMDSFHISFRAHKSDSNDLCDDSFPLCNYLYVDDLQFFSSTTVTNESFPFDLDYFPNPSRGLLTIRCVAEKSKSYKIDLVNVLGEKMQENLPVNQPFYIGNFPAGAYFLLAENENGVQKAFKILIE